MDIIKETSTNIYFKIFIDIVYICFFKIMKTNNIQELKNFNNKNGITNTSCSTSFSIRFLKILYYSNNPLNDSGLSSLRSK